MGYYIEYFCSEKSTSEIPSLIMETKIKTVFELETCGFVIHQNYTISVWIDTKKNGEKNSFTMGWKTLINRKKSLDVSIESIYYKYYLITQTEKTSYKPKNCSKKQFVSYILTNHYWSHVLEIGIDVSKIGKHVSEVRIDVSKIGYMFSRYE